jgi:MtN3 and saliva related transmembrane protein
MDWITIIGFAAAFCTTASFLPQAIKTIRTKNTAGISLYMYLLFTAGTFLWLLFGIYSNNKPVMIANFITFGFAAIILFYKVKYGGD